MKLNMISDIVNFYDQTYKGEAAERLAEVAGMVEEDDETYPTFISALAEVIRMHKEKYE